MGPVTRYLGPWVPEAQLWQDPVPAVDHELVERRGRRGAQGEGPRLRPVGLAAGHDGVGVGRVASAAPTSAAGPTARGIRLEPQRDWAVNDPAELATVLQTLEGIQQEFNAAQSGGEDLARRPDRARRLRGGREGGEGRRPRRHRAVRAGSHRRVAGADRRRVVRGARAAGRRLPQLPAARARSCRRRRCCSTGRTC